MEKKSIISLKFSLTRKINAPKKKLSDFEKLQFLNNEIDQNINFVKLPNDNSIFRLFPIISISQKIFSFFSLTLEEIGIDEKVICYHNISN